MVTDNMLTSEHSWVWPESTQQVCSWITMQLAQEILLISLELAKEEERQESGERRKREKERKKMYFQLMDCIESGTVTFCISFSITIRLSVFIS